jgi:hypothetical protein
MKQEIEWCAALLWLLVLEYFQQSYPFPPIKQELSDVLLFCDYFVLESFFQQSYNSTYKAGIEWCAALCDSMCLSIFQQ